MNTVSPWQVSLIHALDLPIPPSPTTPSPSASLYHATHQLAESPLSGSRFHPSVAGSPDLVSRIEFVILRMDRSPPVAPHPASRRRSYSRFHAGERMHEGTCTPKTKCALRRTTAGVPPAFRPLSAMPWLLRAGRPRSQAIIGAVQNQEKRA